MPLTVTEIKNAKPGSKDRKLNDGRGLYLLVKSTGGKLWRMKYHFGGVEKKLSIGAWPEVSLSQARQIRDEAKLAITGGRDPAREKKLAKLEAKTARDQTFEAIGREYIDKREKDGQAPATIKKAKWYLKQFRPFVGQVPLSAISSAELYAALNVIQQSGRRETAKKMRGFAAAVFGFGIATGRAASNPAVGLGRALLVPEVRNQPAVTTKSELGELLVAIDKCTGYPSTLAVLRISPHLFQRPGEIRKMKWTDLDLEQARWTVDVEDTKMRREHAVPLSRQALAIIRDMVAIRRGPYVFPAFHDPSKPVSENTANGALKRMGYGGRMVPHGFRSAASTLLNESGRWSRDAIERASSRKVGAGVASIYNRGTYWDERVEMMQWWSDFLDDLRASVPVES